MDSNVNDILILDKNLTINGPATNIGAALLVIGIFIGFASFGTGHYYLLVWTLGLLILSCLCLISIECIAIDKKSNRLKLYKDYFIVKFGKWYMIEDYLAMRIIYSIDPPKQNSIHGAARTWQPTQNKSFDIYLISDLTGNLMIRHFTEMKKAQEFQKYIATMVRLTILEPIRMNK